MRKELVYISCLFLLFNLYSGEIYSIQGYESKSCVINGDSLKNGVFVPNVFSPNNDGINDEFQISGIDEKEEWKLFIYNRYGQLQFKTKRPTSIYWDGRSPVGKKLNEGTFFYILINENDENKNRKGSVELVR